MSMMSFIPEIEDEDKETIVRIWRFDRDRHEWCVACNCYERNADDWLARFQASWTDEVFIISDSKPKYAPANR